MRLYKRGAVWWCWFYQDGVRVRRSTRCTDRRAAELAAARWERAAADPSLAAAASATVRSAVERLVEDRAARGRSAATLEYLAGKAGPLLRLLGEDTPLAAVDASEVDRYLAARAAEGVARNTLAKELQTLRAALKLARRRGEYSRDPEAVLPHGLRAEYRPRTRWLTPAELQRLLAELAPARAAEVAWIVATGSRLGEAARAERGDVDMRAGLVSLRGTKTERAARVVPVLPHTRELLRRALRHAPGGDTGPLFAPWLRGNVIRDLAGACRRAGIERCSPNDLRRTAAQWLRGLGCDATLLAEYLGHTTSAMVERVYGRLEGKRLGTAIASVTRACQTPSRARRKPGTDGQRRRKIKP